MGQIYFGGTDNYGRVNKDRLEQREKEGGMDGGRKRGKIRRGGF